MGKLGKTLVRAAQGPQAGAQRERGVFERLNDLEAFRDGVLRAMRQTFAAVEQRLAGTEEILHAIINLVGQESVQNEVQRLAVEKIEERSLKERAAFESAVKRGDLVQATEVSDQSVVIGTEVDKDGQSLHPLRVQLLYASVKEGYKEKLKAAKVGDKIETPAGSTFEVLEIWDVVPPENRPKQAEPGVDATGEGVPSEEIAVSRVPMEADPVDEEVEAALVEELAEAAN